MRAPTLTMTGLPADYYERLHRAQEAHWWPVGMRRIGAALLAGRLTGDLLDAGCGAGGFLAWAARQGTFDRLAGVDASAEAVAIASSVAPAAEVRTASLRDLPFADDTFDVAVLADVLQHVRESEVDLGLRELRRVLRADGALLVRTNGSRTGHRAREDWRLYDARMLMEELTQAGFRVERMTHANMLLSLLGREPAPPTPTSCGIPEPAGRLRGTVGSALLALEARYLRASGRSLPSGHTLFALAVPSSS